MSSLPPLPPPSNVDPDIFRLLSAFEYIQIMTLGILTWEILVTLPREIFLYRSNGPNKTLLLLSFSRYYTLICLAADMVATPDLCHRIRWVLPFLSTTIQFAAIPLLLLPAVLVIFWIVPLAIGTFVATTYAGIPYAVFVNLDVIGGCGNDPTNSLGTVPFILNLVVDSAIFLLTLGRLVFTRTTATTLSRILIRDGTIYYLAVVIVNVVNIVFFLAPNLPPLARPLIATPATIIPAIMVGRLYFNLTSSFLPAYGTSGSEGRSFPLSAPRSTFGSGGTAMTTRPLNLSAATDLSSRSDVYPMAPMNVKYTVEVTADPAPTDSMAPADTKTYNSGFDSF
ncbi:hypothetical protein BDP27DRAFT_1311960 [Rhodocollybia butyracea]|uniref:Uncharacterized protein n=1 Tax=Rhodocollybia butyracea TaxID=206335 RepID=A0A9P5Q8E9_9AGAR|nr:hypothetical protein BDP27DRAFT_1311960 [Rhodocollybia butyracea]